MLHPPVPPARRSFALAATLILLLGAPTLAQQNGQRITPNFKDADITQLIEAVSAATGKNFIIDPRVRAQVTWISGAGTTMTPEQFYQGFLSVLQVHGFVAVPAGNIIKVLPDANMRQFPGNDLPNRIGASSDDLVTQVITVTNVSAAQLVPVLRPLMAQNAQLQAVAGANMLVISDRGGNVNRMARIIERIDQSTSADIDVIPLQSATAADTVRVLSSLVGQTGGDTAGPAVRIVADDRSNSVLISGDATQRLRLRALVANLDTPLDTGGETYVRYLNYAKAEDLASKLKEQIAGSATGPTSGAPRGPVPNPAAPVNAASAATVSLAGGTGTIWADKDTNALIITAPQRTMRAINAVIDKLDIRRAQVQVEAIIVEVAADKTSDLGVNWVVDGSNSKLAVGGFIEPIGGTSIIDLYNASKGTSSNLAAANGTTIGIGRLQATGVNFAAIIRALQGDSRTNIVSHPMITMRDNEESKIEVAQEVPFITGQYTNTTGAASAFQTVQRQQVGTILTVTPQINEGDAVILKIQVESSSIAASSAGAVDLITNKRTISTTVLIPDAGTLVIGGLIQDKAINSEQRIPILGRIPLIGELFRTRDTGKTKTNLMVFIQPRILRDNHQAAVETDSKYNYMREEQRRVDRETTLLPLQPMQKGEQLPPLIQPDLAAPAAPAAPGAAPPAPSATPAPQSPAPGSTP
ncbi:MAG TPA: type II secretion system secretin GspD [Steroidobacteraceae bacterium]|nr:type II secretion system secretin GspD [Steroidobacteraceae bacterium]